MSGDVNRKLKLKTFQYKTQKLPRKIFIEKTTLPEVLETDNSTINFSKKVGGQLNQFYRLQEDLKLNKNTYPYAIFNPYSPIDFKDSFYLTPVDASIRFTREPTAGITCVGATNYVELSEIDVNSSVEALRCCLVEVNNVTVYNKLDKEPLQDFMEYIGTLMEVGDLIEFLRPYGVIVSTTVSGSIRIAIDPTLQNTQRRLKLIFVSASFSMNGNPTAMLAPNPPTIPTRWGNEGQFLMTTPTTEMSVCLVPDEPEVLTCDGATHLVNIRDAYSNTVELMYCCYVELNGSVLFDVRHLRTSTDRASFLSNTLNEHQLNTFLEQHGMFFMEGATSNYILGFHADVFNRQVRLKLIFLDSEFILDGNPTAIKKEAGKLEFINEDETTILHSLEVCLKAGANISCADASSDLMVENISYSPLVGKIGIAYIELNGSVYLDLISQAPSMTTSEFINKLESASNLNNYLFGEGYEAYVHSPNSLLISAQGEARDDLKIKVILVADSLEVSGNSSASVIDDPPRVQTTDVVSYYPEGYIPTSGFTSCIATIRIDWEVIP